MVLVVIAVLVFVMWRVKKHVKKAKSQKQPVQAPVKRKKSFKVADIPYFLLDEPFPFPKKKKSTKVTRGKNKPTVNKRSRQVAKPKGKAKR